MRIPLIGIAALIVATLGASLGIASTQDGGPVLVIIRSTDSDASLNQTFIDDAKQARDLYEKAGFQVIELVSGVDHPLTSDAIKTVISGVKTSELHVLLDTHGISNEKHEFYLQPAAISQDPIISGSQLKEAIRTAIQNNPGLKVYIPALSCYSGTLGDQLADVPGVITLPATGADRPTFLSDGYDPVKNLLKDLSQHQTYFEAEESAWRGQLEQFTQGSFALTASVPEPNLPMPMRELPFSRTGPQLFLESWCAAQAKTPWATQQFCITDSSIKIPDALKISPLQDLQNTNQKHLTILQKLYNLSQCSSALDPNLDEFNSLRTSLLKRSIQRLKEKVDNLSTADFQKNQIAELKGEIDQIRRLQITLMIPAQAQDQIKILQGLDDAHLKTELESFKGATLGNIQSFEHDCLQGTFDPGKQLGSGALKDLCGNYFSWASQDWSIFSPEDLNSPTEDLSTFKSLDGTSAQHQLAPITEFSGISKIFRDDSQKTLSYLNNLSKKYPVYAAMTALSINGLPSFKNYCALIDGSIQESKQDLACAEKFRANGTAGDWSRFLDLNSLGQRKLLPGTSP